MIQAMSHAYRCIQRLGYLKRVVHRSVRSATSTVDGLGDDLVNAVTKTVSVGASKEILAYVSTRLTDGKYKALRAKAKNITEDINADAKLSIELQDAYLSDSMLASTTGKLVKNDYRFYPYYAVNLGFIRAGTYSAQVRAIAFASIVSDAERFAFDSYDPANNPLILSLQQKIFLLYCMLECDADVVWKLWPLLKSVGKEFTDRDGGFELAGVYKDLAKEASKGSLTVEERERLQRLRDIAVKIENWRGKAYTGKGAFVEPITPRLEPYCDIGVFEKPDRAKYRYGFSKRGAIFVKDMVAADSSMHFLSTKYFRSVAKLLGKRARQINDDVEIVERLYTASKSVQSALGYSPITDLGLLASARALAEDKKYFELGGLKDTLVRYNSKNPKVLRFTVDRMGNTAHVKFLSSPVKVIVGGSTNGRD